ncbi:MAG: T9SS type A sorting domain-containing protein [Flavobacteriaceae bacterium]|nr:T9SS type A sorting domain-containing protein [Flavobacteriaceae bacterium]
MQLRKTVCLATIFLIFGFSTLYAQNSSSNLASKALKLASEMAKSGRWGMIEGDMSDAKIQDFVYGTDGISHAYVLQTLKGVPVMNGIMGLHFDNKGSLVYATNRAKPHLVEHIIGNISELNTSNLGKQALLNESIKDEVVWEPITQGMVYEESKNYTQTVLWPNEKGELVFSQYFVFYNHKTSDWVNIWMAADGSLLQRHSWTVHCNTNGVIQSETRRTKNLLEPSRPISTVSSLILTGSGPIKRRGDGSSYNVFSFPTESPLYGNRTTIYNPADIVASPYGWHDVNGISGAEYTITRGNNVYATEDGDANNNPGYSPDGGSALKFDFNYNVTDNNPASYKDFSIANLFVANNLLHDISQYYGFDEVSGNFQSMNYEGVGIDNDAINADAQDGSGKNNANFSTPPDGSSPRMQMFIWDGVMGNASLKVNDGTGIKFRVGITDGNWGKKITDTNVSGKLVLVKDNVASATSKCCTNLANGPDVKGNIAAIVRGSCTFVQKVYRAQSYGATAVVLLDTSSVDQVITMANDNTSQAAKIKIPVVFVKFSDANKLRKLLADSSINISFYDSSSFAKKTDSDLDMGVMAHEFTHGISIRLTCGPSNSNGLSNAEQMGEGWSDFIGLAFTSVKGDMGSKNRGVGNWLVGEDQKGGGIRSYPNTTNMGINLLTYASLAKAVSGTKTEVHYTGEIWCSMLWDMYWKFVDQYGFDGDLYNGKGGNNMAIQLVFDGMKLQPCGPGFVDARDAILAADSIRNRGANKKIIWEAFARRGLGYSAAQGDPNNCADGEEAFDMPPSEPSAIKRIDLAWFRAYPNPVNNDFFIEPMNVYKISDVEVYDLQGKQQKIFIDKLEGGGMRLDLSDLNSGIYELRISASDYQASVKLIKP